MSPYETLGVGRTATEAEVKAAYRRLAKTAHPDVGGDRDGFERLQQAYAVLMDPKARAHYDATGEILGTEPDNAHGPALGCLTATFDAVIGEIMRNGADPKKSDIVALMRTHIRRSIEHRAKEREIADCNRPRWEEMRNRFTAKDGKPNRMATIVGHRIANIDRIAREYEQMDIAARAALEILEDHEYRVDQDIAAQMIAAAAQQRPAFGFGNIFGAKVA